MDVVGEIAAAPRRTKRRGRHPDKALSAAFVRSAPPGRHADGNGLYLFVQPTGTGSWVQRLVIRGRRRELGLGAAGLVSLVEARELALANRKLARSGAQMRAKREHRVPLCGRALKVLDAARTLGGSNRLVFPRDPGRGEPHSSGRPVDVVLMKAEPRDRRARRPSATKPASLSGSFHFTVRRVEILGTDRRNRLVAQPEAEALLAARTVREGLRRSR